MEPLLKGFAALRSQDADEVRAWLQPMFSLRDFDAPEGGRQFDCVINHCRLPSLSLVYAQYGSPFSTRIHQGEFYLQGFPLSGAGEVRWSNQVMQVQRESAGFAGGPGSEARFSYDETFSHLILRIAPAALTQRLAALLDRPVDPPLQVTGRSNLAASAGQLRLLRFLAEEMDQGPDRLPEPVIAELEDAVLVNYLMATEHNYSGQLSRRPAATAPWQVRRAVDYMEQHWDQPITIGRLTQVAGTSARSLFLLFRKTHGVSPMAYLSRIRLRHARELLRFPAPGTSVTRVGLLCGFSNLGHFASKYHSVFGEKPSETLRNSLR